MTAAAPPARGERQAQVATTRVPWRRLAWVTWRQRRVALAAMLVVFGIAALALLLAGLPMHEAAAWFRPSWLVSTSAIQLQLIPVLAGLFLGAPLLAREAENGTTRLAWTQGVSRTRWLLAQVVPVAVLLAAAAIGLGLEFGWRRPEFGDVPGLSWRASVFDLHPLPFAGWVTLAFSLGVFLGAVIRRTVPAMAATIACYATLLYETSVSWRMAYLAPLRRLDPQAQITSGGGYSFYWGSSRGPGPDILSTDLTWPDGRPLSDADLNHGAAWFSQHHIRLSTTYQPASRYLIFQYIEFGWLGTAAVILLAATVVLIRRRAA